MRMRSTGLGKTELKAEVKSIQKIGDLVIFEAYTTKPVRWHVRIGFQEKDMRRLVILLLRPRNLWYVIRALFCSEDKVPKSETF